MVGNASLIPLFKGCPRRIECCCTLTTTFLDDGFFPAKCAHSNCLNTRGSVFFFALYVLSLLTGVGCFFHDSEAEQDNRTSG